MDIEKKSANPEEFEGKKIRVAIVTNILPEYRRDFYKRLFEFRDMDVVVFCQSAIPGTNLRSIHADFGVRVCEIEYVGLKAERLGFQKLPWRRLLMDFDILFVYGNPRIISNLILGLLSGLLRRVVVVTGQLHSAGSSRAFEMVRLAWWSCFRNLFLYTDAEVGRLKSRKGFRRKTIIGMNNGLNQDSIDAAKRKWGEKRLGAWRNTNIGADTMVILSCARLVRKNGFSLVIDALPDILLRLPKIRWVVIGDGPEKSRLRQMAQGRKVSKHIEWIGSIYVEEDLAPWFLSAAVFVHPDCIGLSLLHSFGYEVPVVTHGDKNFQFPEFAAFEDGSNGVAFKRHDHRSLAHAIYIAIERREELRAGTKGATANYNTRTMAKRFHEICTRASGV